MTKSKSDFLAHLQGIRAVAVILVLIFHYNSDNLPGGFIGVDMFFVVSGFIITRLILNEIKVTGRLNLFQFWERRIRRLLPAATVVLVTTLWLSILYIDETKLISIATQILYAAIYIVNWAFASQSVDYAERGSDLSPVLHYWSLSIEEQFYIGWPMLLALLAVIGRTHKSKLRLIATFISITTLLSFYWSVITSYSIDFKASYFTTTTRIWQLAVGGLVAIVLQKIDSSRSYLSQINSNKIFGLVVSWLGMLIIVWCSFRLNLDLRYPGSIALLPVIATVLLILSDKGGDWSLTPILEWKPVQYIGDISYSIYLWHWPVHIFLPLILQKYSLHLNQVWLYILVTFSLSVLSKHCIEDPFRYNLGFLKSLKHRNAYILGLLLITVTATFSLKIKSDTETQIEYAKALFLNSIDSNYPGAAALDPNYSVSWNLNSLIQPDPLIAKFDLPDLYNDGCDKKQTDTAFGCVYGKTDSDFKVYLVGDSHAAQYMPAFQKLADQNQWQLTVFEKAACPLTDIIIRFQETGDIKSDCQSWKSQVIDIISTDRPDLVVVAGGLPNIYRGYYWLPNDQEITTGYVNVWQSLKEQSISILAIRDNPRPIIDIPSCVASNRTNVELCSRLKSEVLDNHFDPLVEAAKIADVSLLDLTDLFCVAEKCPAVIGNTLVYRDGDHLTASFARSLAPYIDISIQLLLQTKKPSAETL